MPHKGLLQAKQTVRFPEIGGNMFSFFKKKLTEADAAKAFCHHINQWAYEHDTLLKSSIQNLHKDTLTINDFTQHSDALFHATVAQCSMTIENLFPKDQAIRLLTKIFETMDSIGDIELFDIFMKANSDPDRYQYLNAPDDILQIIPARLLKYWLGDKLKELYVKIGDFECLGSLEIMLVNEMMFSKLNCWKTLQKQYKIIK